LSASVLRKSWTPDQPWAVAGPSSGRSREGEREKQRALVWAGWAEQRKERSSRPGVEIFVFPFFMKMLNSDEFCLFCCELCRVLKMIKIFG
jgi:hypothetical protein